MYFRSSIRHRGRSLVDISGVIRHRLVTAEAVIRGAPLFDTVRGKTPIAPPSFAARRSRRLSPRERGGSAATTTPTARERSAVSTLQRRSFSFGGSRNRHCARSSCAVEGDPRLRSSRIESINCGVGHVARPIQRASFGAGRFPSVAREHSFNISAPITETTELGARLIALATVISWTVPGAKSPPKGMQAESPPGRSRRSGLSGGITFGWRATPGGGEPPYRFWASASHRSPRS
ncbi:MAG: hypothetical protein RL417_1445 [Pseudomonadota bacterium]